MSLRNGFVLLLALSTVSLLVGCGSSGNGSSIGVAPPSGEFTANNLNGTYVFSIVGTDQTYGDAYTLLGQFTANGKGGITGGVVDMNDPVFPSLSTPAAPLANASIGSSSYTMGPDGRGTITLPVANPLGGAITLDFVLQNSFHGLVTEFDGIASGSGTLDVQTANTTPNGAYAFSFSGGFSEPFVTVGNFTVSGSSISGLEDFNSDGVPYTNDGTGETLSGNLALGPSSAPSTVFSTTNFSITYDVFAIDATHLKFIEMDTQGVLIGDAFSQTSTNMPTGTMSFTLGGFLAGGVSFAAGGFLATDASGDITSASNEDFNEGDASSETASSAPITFTGSYSASPSAGSGRFILTNLSGNGFEGGTEYAAYPSSGGLLLLEIDGTLGIEAGAAYPQTSTATLAASQGYGLNLSGIQLGTATGSEQEVDDIAEFAVNSAGTVCDGQTSVTMVGLIDENYSPGGGTIPGQPFCDTYGAPDANGRTQISTAGSTGTLNGGFLLNSYPIDGTNFSFIELDSGQISTGVFFEQNAAATSPTDLHSNRFVMQPLIRPHAATLKNKKTNR